MADPRHPYRDDPHGLDDPYRRQNYRRQQDPFGGRPQRDAAFDQLMSRILPKDEPRAKPKEPKKAAKEKPEPPMRKLSAWDHVANALAAAGSAPGKVSHDPDVEMGPDYRARRLGANRPSTFHSDPTADWPPPSPNGTPSGSPAKGEESFAGMHAGPLARIGYRNPDIMGRGPERIQPLDQPRAGYAKPRPYGKEAPPEPEHDPWTAPGQVDLGHDLGLPERLPQVGPRTGDAFRDIGIDPNSPKKPSAWARLMGRKP